jgi:hypothetical protein
MWEVSTKGRTSVLATKPLENPRKSAKHISQNYARLNDIFSQIGIKKKGENASATGKQRKQRAKETNIHDGYNIQRAAGLFPV